MMFNDFNDGHGFSSIKKHCQIYKQNSLNLPTLQCAFLSKRLLTHKIITSYIFVVPMQQSKFLQKKINRTTFACVLHHTAAHALLRTFQKLKIQRCSSVLYIRCRIYCSHIYTHTQCQGGRQLSIQWYAIHLYHWCSTLFYHQLECISNRNILRAL